METELEAKFLLPPGEYKRLIKEFELVVAFADHLNYYDCEDYLYENGYTLRSRIKSDGVCQVTFKSPVETVGNIRNSTETCVDIPGIIPDWIPPPVEGSRFYPSGFTLPSVYHTAHETGFVRQGQGVSFKRTVLNIGAPTLIELDLVTLMGTDRSFVEVEIEDENPENIHHTIDALRRWYVPLTPSLINKYQRYRTLLPK